MLRIVRIGTHHDSPLYAAQLYFQEGVIAVGFIDDRQVALAGDRDEIKEYFRRSWDEYTEQEVGKWTASFLKFRDKVKIGDIVFAYMGDNTVALVGKIVGEHEFNERNRVGDPYGEIQYPNQRRVEWWNQPRYFSREFLSKDIASWVAMQDTIHIRRYSHSKLQQMLEKIPSQDARMRALVIESEEEIQDYIFAHIEKVEAGLTLIKKEQSIPSRRMDFLAIDKHGTHVVIEAKLKAKATAVSQIMRYMQAYKRKKRLTNIRGIIVAEQFTQGCLEKIEELKQYGVDIQAVKCRKTFDFAKASIVSGPYSIPESRSLLTR